MSKGSKRRPQQVADQYVKDEWDRIFKKKETKFIDYVKSYITYRQQIKLDLVDKIGYASVAVVIIFLILS